MMLLTQHQPTQPSNNTLLFNNSLNSNLNIYRALDTVTDAAIAHFRSAAEKILETRDATEALAAALACISGTTDIVPRSLLTRKEVKYSFQKRRKKETKLRSFRIIRRIC